MHAIHARGSRATAPLAERLAGAPISWGASEVPGWGVMPSPDTHLLIGATDPVQFAQEHGDRVNHLHLKDVDATLAAEVRAGRRSLLSATKHGLVTALGRGDARIAEVLNALHGHGYDGWLVLEQDTAITGDEPTVAGGPMRDARESIVFVHHSARTTEEINR